MRPAFGWWCSACVALACALPKYDVDSSLGSGTGASGGAGGSTSGGGKGGQGTTPGSGGSSAVVAGQGGATDDPRELACGDYCTTYLQNCLTSPANTYTGLDDCLNTCFTSDWPFGDNLAEVNSVQCRDLHAHLAHDLPDPHCFHSAKVPHGTSCAPPSSP
jgi:hypothetical protein